MFKKIALGVACLGLLVSTSVWANGPGGGFGGGCGGGDLCEVKRDLDIHLGLDLKLDLDVCADFGNAKDDYYSAQAVILQAGEGNEATITQQVTNAQGIIIQVGNDNEAETTQSGAKDFAMTIQVGCLNEATIQQGQAGNMAAVIGQYGTSNVATITQP
ncbi:MAG: hypothetical protein N3A56_07360 [Thermodesulfobacteriaceae bacterium]|nr:hypothetical protein [Thermodesulfobacteriaceae bacterium]